MKRRHVLVLWLAATPVIAGAQTTTDAAAWLKRAAHGTPILESIAGVKDSVAATFVIDADSAAVRRVALAGGPGTLDSTSNALRRLAGSNVWVGTFHLPSRARFLYMFAVDSTPVSTARAFVRDTFNAKTAAVAPGVASSLFEGPTAASLNLSVARPGVPKGKVAEREFESALLHQTRHIWTYMPPGYGAAQHLPLLVVFDGAPYTNVNYVPTPTILDNLIADHAIRPVVAVFIDTPQPSRRVDLWLSAPFADFVTDELIPWARKTYGLSTLPSETIAAGSSLGGLTSAFVALRRPNIVGRAISQSGSYWTGKLEGSDADKAPEWITKWVTASPHVPVELWMEVGSYESAASNPIGMAPTNRRLRDLLVAKGYKVSYREFSGGHEYINWRASLPEALKYFLGGREQ